MDEYAVNVISVGILEGLKANCNNDAVRAFLLPPPEWQAYRRRSRCSCGKSTLLKLMAEHLRGHGVEEERILLFKMESVPRKT